jgi:hypothetical protein
MFYMMNRTHNRAKYGVVAGRRPEQHERASLSQLSLSQENVGERAVERAADEGVHEAATGQLLHR